MTIIIGTIAADTQKIKLTIDSSRSSKVQASKGLGIQTPGTPAQGSHSSLSLANTKTGIRQKNIKNMAKISFLNILRFLKYQAIMIGTGLKFFFEF